MATLNVWAGNELVGLLGHDPQANRFSFDYAASWLESRSAFPLSPQLPLRRSSAGTAEQHSAQVRQFFENLLPEGEALDHAAQAAGTTRSNLVGLLIAIGKETAGALRVTLSDGAVAPGVTTHAPDSLRRITPRQLSQRIRDRENRPFSVWDGKVRLSIAGYQDKIAVYEREGKWYLVEGSKLASTVIVKPAPMRKQLASLPANEHMCMQLARRIGLEAADTRLVHVPEPVLLVRRFDRIEHEDEVTRVHIVDGCQALGLAVPMKYERAYGDARDVAHLREGVSLPRLFGVLEQSPVPAVDKRKLLQWAIFQVLIGNTDAHGKNVSFYCDGNGLRLAPAYDMVCMSALDAGFPDTYAMAIGDAFTENELSPFEWAHFAYLCKLPFRLVARELDGLATKVLAVMDGLAADMNEQGVPAPVAKRFQKLIRGTCTRQLEHVQQIARFKQADFA
ncbi:MAG: type toxin-antitoxin system HipA family toxin [Ramlibacter sp.]|jgi:serine/threonine-protein kinase HipA|nr:type toxin-antitoxin system HipA family toxin [Ramlibacter sp.]